jgi:DNA-directed RNA polymerase subunit L
MIVCSYREEHPLNTAIIFKIYDNDGEILKKVRDTFEVLIKYFTEGEKNFNSII